MAFFSSTRSSIKRLVSLSSVLAEEDPIDPGWMEWLLKKLVRSRVNDLVVMEKTVMDSDICCTFVRLPFLNEGTDQFTHVQFFNMVIVMPLACIF